MSIIFCIAIAVVAQRWDQALIGALVVGLILCVAETSLHIAEHPNMQMVVPYAAIGLFSFVAETAAFYAVKLGVRKFRARPCKPWCLIRFSGLIPKSTTGDRARLVQAV
jgi:hypothetical protein